MSAEQKPSAAAAWGRMILCVLIVIGIDQATKALVVGEIVMGERREVLPFLDFVYVVNEGVAFGFLGDSSRGLVLAVTVAAFALVLGWFAFNSARPFAWLAVGLLAGGALGNLIDRIARDGVVDFIDFPLWPSFNVADIAITLGAATLAIIALTAPEPQEPAAEETPRGAG